MFSFVHIFKYLLVIELLATFLVIPIGVSTPKGRRGHTALVHKGTMLIYGGYQDLKGSCGELWAYHFGKFTD